MLIEIFSDLVCPWCFIGKHRLERAIAERPHLRVERRWQPYQLNPDMPESGMDRFTYLTWKFGNPDRARQVSRSIEAAAEADGLALDLEAIRWTPNTLDAHRTVRFAAGFGLADDMTEALFRAYFISGLDIGDRSVLSAVAASVGLDPGAVAVYLDSDRDIIAVRTNDLLARQLGIQAVPSFIFDHRYMLAGAQEPDAFRPLFDLVEEAESVGIGG